MRTIMTALAPLECRHPRLGQSIWRLGVMRLLLGYVCVCTELRPSALQSCVCT